MIPAMVGAKPQPVWVIIGVALAVLYGAAFMVAAPISWSLSARGRLVVCGTLFAMSLLFIPWLGGDVVGLWTYVGVIVGMCMFRWSVTISIISALGLTALVIQLTQYRWSESLLIQPVIILSISLLMAAFGRTIAVINELRATQEQLEFVTAERERGRVARDIHDILGHSLTVITVKADLAVRLMDVDMSRARAEIVDVEALARGALADVRATVSGYRATTASGELAAARGALSAAELLAELPSSVDAIPAEQRELVGWVIREGVTNVVRHARASRCRIVFSEGEIEVADDGIGLADGDPWSTGLNGLRERVEAAGGRLSVGQSDLGGFSLRVSLPREARGRNRVTR